MNTLKISINKITESLVIFKKIGKCNCMRFFFCRVYIGYVRSIHRIVIKVKVSCIMPPTLKKLEGHFTFEACVFVCVYVSRFLCHP